MNTKVMKRIETLERRLDISALPANERLIVIPYPNGNHAEFDRQYQQHLSELKAKYGQNISEDDLLVVGIRKF
jgi:hypothetical protein